MSAVYSPRFGLGCRKGKDPSDEGQVPQGHYPEQSGAWSAGDVGYVNEKYEQEEHDTQESARLQGIFSDRDTQCGTDKAGPHKKSPEHVSWDPVRHHARHEWRRGEMFRAEDGNGNRQEYRTQSDDFLQTLLLRKLAPGNREQRGPQDYRRGEIG